MILIKMDLIVYPYIRIVTPENLAEAGLPQRLIDDTLNGMKYSFNYQAGFPQSNIIVAGEKDEPIEDLISKLDVSVIKLRIEKADKILVVRNSPDYKEMFRPSGIELGDIEELDEGEDYQTFVRGVNELMKR